MFTSDSFLYKIDNAQRRLMKKIKFYLLLVIFSLAMTFWGLITGAHAFGMLAKIKLISHTLNNLPFCNNIFFYSQIHSRTIPIILYSRIALSLLQIVTGLSLLYRKHWALNSARILMLIGTIYIFLNPFYPHNFEMVGTYFIFAFQNYFS